MCRNFEWQLCAAMGRLPKQSSGKIKFAFEPSRLWLDGSHGSPKLGSCSGFHLGKCNAADNYANDDVYFLEVCIFNEICRNGAQMFRLAQYADFFCDLSFEALGRLRTLLLEGPAS